MEGNSAAGNNCNILKVYWCVNLQVRQKAMDMRAEEEGVGAGYTLAKKRY